MIAELMKERGRPHGAIAFIKKLYRIELQIKYESDEVRHRQRQLLSIPILNQFKA